MNFLAHCYLSPASSAAIVGNLLGDFSKGVDESQLSNEVKAGLINHRLVDKFTDSHVLVVEAKSYFSPQRRRFAGIALDVLFDHYLIKHWQAFSDASFAKFKRDTYQLILEGLPLMPDPMAQVMARVVSQDWFANYQSLEGIGNALDRIAVRIRFSNQFSGCIEDILLHEAYFQKVFLEYFPLLIKRVSERSL